MLPVCPAVSAEAACAKLDVSREIKLYGFPFEFLVRDESTVKRDIYKSVRYRDSAPVFDFKAFPVNYNPSQRQLEKAGLRQQAEVTIHTAVLDWENYGLGFDDIDIERSTINLGGQMYEVKEKALVGQVGPVLVYISFGLVRR